MQGLQAAQEGVLYCFSGFALDSRKFSCKNCAKNNFNSGEEPCSVICKMPELYVEALLEELKLCKHPQAAMQSKSKRVRNLLPTSPELASELRWELKILRRCRNLDAST